MGEKQVAGGEWDGGLGVERCESGEWCVCRLPGWEG